MLPCLASRQHVGAWLYYGTPQRAFLRLSGAGLGLQACFLQAAMCIALLLRVLGTEPAAQHGVELVG